MRELFPEQPLARIPKGVSLLTPECDGYDFRKVTRRDPQQVAPDEPFAARTRRVEPKLEDIELDGRWVVIFSPYYTNHTRVIGEIGPAEEAISRHWLGISTRIPSCKRLPTPRARYDARRYRRSTIRGKALRMTRRFVILLAERVPFSLQYLKG